MFDHNSVIAAETKAFAAAIASADPAAPVPTCPDWTVADLAWHLTEVHAFWASILSSGALTDDDQEAVEQAKPPRPGDVADTLAMLATETDALVAVLAERPDERPAWSWFESDQTVGFTRRMQVHEAVMHRIDAQLAAGGEVTPIDGEVAVAGIRHAIEVMFAWWGTLPGFTFTPQGGAVAFDVSDPGVTLLVQPGRWRGVGQSGTSYDEPGVVLTRQGDPVATFSGSAEDLDRWLWGRGDEPSADGDEAALDAVRAMVAAGIQ